MKACEKMPRGGSSRSILIQFFPEEVITPTSVMLLSLLLLALCNSAYSDCAINLDQRTGKYQPLLLTANGEIIYPTTGRSINIVEGDQVRLYCHSSEKSTSLLTATSVPALLGNSEEIYVICHNRVFQALNGGAIVDVLQAACSKRMYPWIRKLSAQESPLCSMLGAGDETMQLLQSLYTVQVGWNITGSPFIEQYRVCIDDQLYGTIWTKHAVMGASIEYKDTYGTRPGFRKDNKGKNRFFSNFSTTKSLSSLYRKASQVKMVTSLFGTNTINEENIIDSSSSGTNYLAKGHLAPDAAFIYKAEQDATYYFFNVAPQFQSFNNGNWKQLEAASREIASRRQRDIIVYTGTTGVLSYNINHLDAELYLRPQTPKAIPVPNYYWSVLYDPVANDGVGFLGMNDPHSEDVTSYLCANICDKLDWIDWSFVEDETRGHLTCCTLPDLLTLVDYVPELGVLGGSYPKLMV